MSNELMSRVKGMGWAEGAPKLKALPRFILMLMADAVRDKRRGADGDVSWPTIPTLMKQTGASDRSVERAIAELKRVGLISVEKWGRHRNRYRLSLPVEWCQNDGGQNDGGQNDGGSPDKTTGLPPSKRPPYTEDYTEPNRQNVAPRLPTLEEAKAQEEREAAAQDPGPLWREQEPEQPQGYTPPTFTPEQLPEKGPPPPPNQDSPLLILQYFHRQIGEAPADRSALFADQLRCVEQRLKDGFTPDQLRKAAHGAATKHDMWRQPHWALKSRASTEVAINRSLAPVRPVDPPRWGGSLNAPPLPEFKIPTPEEAAKARELWKQING